MPAQLLALTDGPSILLDKPIMLLGRHAECDLQLNSRKVSRRHCCVAVVKDFLVVRDLGSTNGIRINGERVAEGKLKSGDELTIGNFRYQVCLDKAGVGVPVAALPVKGLIVEAKASIVQASDEPIPIDESVAPRPASVLGKPMTYDSDDSFILPEKLRSVPPPSGSK